ncbi:cytochrome c [Iamia sp. SCSIO 61187]|uniref:c-type cytochrome n=1 Tax=Iamia sp. SCSIO 61187 TaxID=2722752 RepID=UPI001C62B614|nr:cytochrome c [Iamia sp. SCSIO 61187]QYG94818.1 cytochrome c [Iamia sp. SCSIO 61187]
MLFASTQSAIGGIALFAALVIVLSYAWINVRQGRAEVGSEIELAPNRKPYYSDEELEGKKLDRTLTFGLIGLFVVAITLPLYWLNEPARQEGAREDFNRAFVARGAAMFDTTENGGFNCAFCHGGMTAEGGTTPFTITDANGQFVKQVDWQGPALNTVFLRFSREEVRYILTYGRTYSPMPAWGVEGGGPLNEQQLQNLMDYLESIQISPEESQAQVDQAVADEMAAAELAGVPYASEGEAMFNLGYYTGFAGGAYACGRCHTTGWSYGEKGADGNGALGPALRGGVSQVRFPGAVAGFIQQVDFVCAGSERGVNYGRNSQGTGRMPGFCQVPAEPQSSPETGEVGVEASEASDPDLDGGMYSKDDVEKIVRYVRGL